MTLMYESIVCRPLPSGVSFISVGSLPFAEYVFRKARAFVFILNKNQPHFQGKVIYYLYLEGDI
jgi:hypothetical protein